MLTKIVNVRFNLISVRIHCTACIATLFVDPSMSAMAPQRPAAGRPSYGAGRAVPRARRTEVGLSAGAGSLAGAAHQFDYTDSLNEFVFLPGKVVLSQIRIVMGIDYCNY